MEERCDILQRICSIIAIIAHTHLYTMCSIEPYMISERLHEMHVSAVGRGSLPVMRYATKVMYRIL